MKSIDLSKKIIIGSAQFGMNYGINNSSGMVKINEIKRILKYAKENKISFLDTAIAYGRSEYNLGRAGCKNYKIISKIPSNIIMNSDINKEIFKQVKNSIALLHHHSLYGILLHSGNDLLSKNRKKIYKALIQCKEKGLVEKIGISVYESKDVFEIIKNFDIDIVQIPFNILNRDLEFSGLLNKLKDKKIEVHVRSVFLQGLLLMNPQKMPVYFHKWNNIWESWGNWLKTNKINPLEACLKFVLEKEEIDKVIVGIDNTKQLEEIIQITKRKYSYAIPDDVCSNDKYLINPYYWG